jgi:Cu-Zn family superoxide dismutase
MKTLLSPVLATLAAALLACAPAALSAQSAPAATETRSAVAVLVPGASSNVKGTIHFTTEAGGVHVQGTIEGLTPGSHGFHVHEFGDLSKRDLMSTGGHFNPEKHPHAGRDAAQRHAGDLGNLEAGQDGKATVDFVDSQLQLNGPNSIVGRAVVVHAKADDLKSQPSGDAGGRIAAGVIGIAK